MMKTQNNSNRWEEPIRNKEIYSYMVSSNYLRTENIRCLFEYVALIKVVMIEITEVLISGSKEQIFLLL